MLKLTIKMNLIYAIKALKNVFIYLDQHLHYYSTLGCYCLNYLLYQKVLVFSLYFLEIFWLFPFFFDYDLVEN